LINVNKFIRFVRNAEPSDDEFIKKLKLLDIIFKADTYADIPFNKITENDIWELSDEDLEHYLDFMYHFRENVRKIPRIVSDEIDFI